LLVKVRHPFTTLHHCSLPLLDFQSHFHLTVIRHRRFRHGSRTGSEENENPEELRASPCRCRDDTQHAPSHTTVHCICCSSGAFP
jgi:hypothetical protein